jgi:hypothetical protein
MLHRFRTALLAENLPLLVLGLLRGSSKSEWELLHQLFVRHELVPGSKEFRKLVQSLLDGGYAALETVNAEGRLRITCLGTELLHRLEDELDSVIRGI